jgi:exonuclease SbcD
MKLLHTADWHIGQTFYEYDRTYEHQQFLEWLTFTIAEKEIDVLLICGDIFDVSNPAAASVALFYKFLMKAINVRPNLQIIIIAGNHDSPARLEAPKPLLVSSNITIVGNVEYCPDGSINYEKLVVPLKNDVGETKAWCIAMPYIRLGDYPSAPNTISSYPDGVVAIYKEAYEYTLTKNQSGEAIIALGHLHALDAEVSADDKSERLIMGGVEFVPVSTFNDNIVYTALGHIHKAQKIGEKETIRYSGSPLPMSFSEVNYKHQVMLLEIDGEQAKNIHALEIPISVGLVRVPTVHKLLNEVLQELNQLPASDDVGRTPYLEVKVLLDSPEPSLRHQIETALLNKNVRLAKIDVKYPTGSNTEEDVMTYEKLYELQPITVFNKIYKSRFNNETPEELLSLFNQVSNEISIKDN